MTASRVPRPGTVEEILVCLEKGTPMQSVPQVQVRAGQGLAGDRRKNITLIEAEKIEAFADQYEVLFSAHDARRNIVTRGIELNPLVGTEFMVGTVRVAAYELCEPCQYLARKTHRQVLHGLLHRGGLRAEIISDGVIRVGDGITPGLLRPVST